MNTTDISGMRFGRWTALRRAQRPGKNAVWLCQCDCGAMHEVYANNLRRGLSKGCAACNKANNPKTNLRHGMSGSREFRIWIGMIQRCTNPKVNSYRRYGGRGIRVCQRWADSFEAFYEDMGPSPGNRHSIDRIDNDGNYEPGNCRWATQREQAMNRTNTTTIRVDGVEVFLRDFVISSGVPLGTYYPRVRKGWPIAIAATVKKASHEIERHGEAA